MKKKYILAVSTLLLTALVGCNNTTSSTANNTLSKSEAETKINAFEKNIKNTTIQATYKADYALTVESENAGAKGFERTIEDETTVSLDLTENSVYLYAKRIGENKKDNKGKITTEALVYKNGSDYYYLTSTMGAEVKLDSEAKALEKISELLKKISYREGGYIDTATFLYEGANKYEHKNFLLDSTNVLLEDMDDPIGYKKTATNGVKIISEMEYVGYATDGGTSELKNEPGAYIEVDTNQKGYVTSFTETYNDATLTMPIMTPAPILHINGERTLAASYGETITKKTTIVHEAVKGTIEIPASFTGGNVQVKTCVPNGFATMTDVKNGDQIDVGNWLCIKPSPAGTNTIKNVSVNGNSIPLVPAEQAGGWYCFEVAEGTNKVSVIFEGSDIVVEKATITVQKDGNVDSVAMVWFPLVNGAPGTMTPITDNTAPIDANNWVALQIKVKEGFQIDQVVANDKATMLLAGFYCFNIKTVGVYAVNIITKAL